MDKAGHSFYPVFLDLRDKSVLLVGGGEVAFRKARALWESRCRLTVVAKDWDPLFRSWLEAQGIMFEERPYREGEAEGHFLIISATDDPEVNRTVFEDAARADRLVNVADQPHLCNLFVPSVLKRRDLQLAISTSGKCPALARRLRLELDAALPERYGPLLDRLATVRDRLQRMLPTPKARREALEALLASDKVQKFLEGEDALLDSIGEEWDRGQPD